MTTLRELTKDNHTSAERQEFVKILFSGIIDPKLYATYLYNQFFMYELLETCAMSHGLLSNMPGILRARAIRSDFEELWGSDEQDDPKLCPVVKSYQDHIVKIKDDPKLLMAHLYVRHMGDLAGGQMIAKKVPGAGKCYQFDDADNLKAAMRLKLDPSMADEAKVCFNFATQFFKEMMEIANINK
jgi:heme oxygenase